MTRGHGKKIRAIKRKSVPEIPQSFDNTDFPLPAALVDPPPQTPRENVVPFPLTIDNPRAERTPEEMKELPHIYANVRCVNKAAYMLISEEEGDEALLSLCPLCVMQEIDKRIKDGRSTMIRQAMIGQKCQGKGY